MKKIILLLCLFFPIATIAAQFINVNDGIYHQIDASNPNFQCGIFTDDSDAKKNYQCYTRIDFEIDKFGNLASFNYIYTLDDTKLKDGRWTFSGANHFIGSYYANMHHKTLFRASWFKNGNVDGLLKIKCTAICGDNK
jgi:hypothetical protein